MKTKDRVAELERRVAILERQLGAPAQEAERVREWREFAEEVAYHIQNYTVPQYGDKPDDQVENWTAEQCVRQVGKYAARFGTNARKGQESLDMFKIAHYAALAYHKSR